MGHADLRIRERTLPAVADRAYELLRDRTTLAAFVQKALTAQHATAAERTALDLEEGEQPARLVVTREGHAVTCLAAGMVTDAPVIPWPRTRTYLEDQSYLLRHRIARNRVEEEDGADTLERAWTHPHRLTRAEFDRLWVLAPLFVAPLLDALRQARKAYELLTDRRSWHLHHPSHRDAVLGAFRMVHSSALMLLLTQDEPAAETAPLLAMTFKDVVLARRGAWVMMSRPRRSLEVLQYATELVDGRLKLVTLCMMGLAVRYPWMRGDVLARLQPLWTRMGEPVLDRAAFHAACQAARVDLRARLLLAVDMVVADSSGGTANKEHWEVVQAARRVREGETEDLAVAASWLGPAHEEVARRWNPLDGMETEPRWRPHPVDRVGAAELERADAWRSVLEQDRVPVDATRFPAALACSLAPPEALVPDDRFRTRRTLHQHLSLFAHMDVDLMRKQARKGKAPTKVPPPRSFTTPVRVEAKPGPNAPCSCGSGKKYKKCCGAA